MGATSNEKLASTTPRVSQDDAREGYLWACAGFDPESKIGQEVRNLSRWLDSSVQATLGPILNPELSYKDPRVMAFVSILPLIIEAEAVGA